MPTNNPKISAYVPEAIKKRITQFKEERGISESQAVTIVLAEYFGIAEALGRSPESVEGVTLARIEAIETKLNGFTESIESCLSKLEKIIQGERELRVDQSELSVVQGRSLEDEQADSKLIGELSVEPPLEEDKPKTLMNLGKQSDSLSEELQTTEATTELINSLLSEPPVKLSPETELLEEDKTKIPVNLLGEPLLEIKPIPGIKLSKLRFGLPKDAIAAIKGKGSVEKLISWTKEKDPDHIAWKFVDSPTKGYIPAEELSSELQSKLLKWIENNII